MNLDAYSSSNSLFFLAKEAAFSGCSLTNFSTTLKKFYSKENFLHLFIACFGYLLKKLHFCKRVLKKGDIFIMLKER